jgi:hypothetical protein
MHLRKVLGTLALAIVFLVQTAHAEEQFIRGVSNIEDMALTADGHWIIGSSMAHKAPPGGIYVIDVANHTPKKVDLSPAPATKLCPQGFDPAKFQPHGIDLVGSTLYVVNHGGRQSIEIFRVSEKSSTPTVTWTDCIPLPEDGVGNGVAARPDGTFYVSNDGPRELVRREGDKLLGKGNILRWSGKAWEVVSGTDRTAWNGIVISKDGKHLYVNNTFEKKVYDFQVGSDAPPKTLDLKFAPDNLRMAKDGTIIIAGFFPGEAGIASGCFVKDVETCGLKFALGRIDPHTLKLTCTEEMEPQPGFDSSTVAIPVGKELWVGTMMGPAIMTTTRCAR